MSHLSAVEKVIAALARHGIKMEVKQFPQGTRTAQEAADAIGTDVGQIVKSLVFLAGDSPVLSLVSGANLADTDKLSRLFGAEVSRAHPQIVRDATGFAIGGVPPCGHDTELPTVIDRDLMQHERVYAAAGTPFTVFGIEPEDLVRVSGGRVADVAVDEK